MNVISKFLHFFAGHTWFYFERAGMGDFLKRTCSKCARKETYYGERGYFHNKQSEWWMTDEEYDIWVKEMKRVQKL